MLGKKERTAVKNGALLLDLKYEGWFKRIDKNNFSMRDVDKCVCGQQGYFYDVIANLGYLYNPNLVYEWGFSLKFPYDIPINLKFWEERYKEWEQLTSFWLEEIQQREQNV